MSVLEHIDELAELYALGSLDETQRERVDAHAAACALCAARIGEAEAAVAAMVRAVEPPRSLDKRMRATFAWGANWRWAGPLVAAAFVLALLPSVWLWQTQRANAPFDRDRRTAIVAMLHSHFTHTAFVPLAADAPKAKVLFARGSAWCYVVAQTRKPYEVRASSGGRYVKLGTLYVSGDAAELFVARTGARTLELYDGSRPVARATLPYRR
jgi:hypothetical protein